MNTVSIPSVEAPISVLPTLNVGNVTSTATDKIPAVAGGLCEGIPSVSLPLAQELPSTPKLSSINLPSIPTAASLGSATDKLTSLTRGALPEPKLGLDGLKSSVMGPVNVDSLIGGMKPSLAGKVESTTGALSNTTSEVTKQIQSAQSTVASAVGQYQSTSAVSNVAKNITPSYTV